MRNALLLMPEEFAVCLFIGAGLAMVVGARQLAAGLLVSALAVILLPVLLAPVFDALPMWLLLLVMLFFALSLLRILFAMLIGRRATDHMVGTLTADVVRAAALAPFRLIFWAVRALFRRRQP